MCQTNYNTETKKYKHLNFIERTQIERWYNKDKKTIKEIAELLDKSERTIRREIKRGYVKNLTSNLEEIYVYSATIAHNKYQRHLRDKGPNIKLGNDYALKEYIEKGIKEERKSPEVIVAEIKKKDISFKTKICAKTIRNYISAGDLLDIEPKDMIYKKQKKNKNQEKRVCSKVPAEKSIDFRPDEANNRDVYGHWEGDLVVGKRKKGAALFTLTERKTREEIIVKIKDKSAKSVAKAMDKIERKYSSKFYQKFKTITFDNGSEFRNYDSIEKSCRRKKKRVEIYYAHPYRSGERGSNENNNRLIRRFIAKGVDIDFYSNKDIQLIEDWINNLSRPMFGFKSALEIREELESTTV